jgi:predicted methyltransferase
MPLKRFVWALLPLALGACMSMGPGRPSGGDIAAAVGDSARPAADVGRDPARHPAQLMAFAGVKAGGKVADYMPGSGYFTRIFARVVGPGGHVYAIFPEFMAKFDQRDADAVRALAADKRYANIGFSTTPDGALAAPEPLDLVWTSDNYHDLAFGLSHEQIVALDRSIYAALKPGGILVVVDHAAAPGVGWSVAKTLHRIDPEAVKADMAEAGFRLEAQSGLLANPKDPHTAVVFDPSIRGHTDQIVLRFRKPG